MKKCFYGKTIEIIRKSLNLISIDMLNTYRILNRQSNLSFDDKFAECEKIICIHLRRKLTNWQNLFLLGFVY